MTRIRNFFFDIMVVAGIAAIQLNTLGNYLWILIVLGLIGLILTYMYNHLVARVLFKDYIDLTVPNKFNSQNQKIPPYSEGSLLQKVV